MAEKTKRKIGGFCCLLALLLVFTAYPLEKSGTVHYNAVYVLFALLVPFIFYWSKDLTWDARIGEYSYPIYLFHFTFSRIAINYAGESYYAEIMLLLTLAFSYSYLRLIDPIIESKRQRIAQNRAIA